MDDKLSRSAVIAGVAESDLGKVPGKSSLELQAQAAPLEAEDAQAQIRAQKQATDAIELAARQRVDALSKSVRSQAEIRRQEIDQLNILQATMLAMSRAVTGLRLKPVRVLVDGNRLPPLDVPGEAIVKGDALVQSISAASILAKVTRDRWCRQLHQQYPQYGFDAHKGYGTAVHLAALREHGACPEHRRSFAPVAQAGLLVR